LTTIDADHSPRDVRIARIGEPENGVCDVLRLANPMKRVHDPSPAGDVAHRPAGELGAVEAGAKIDRMVASNLIERKIERRSARVRATATTVCP
jgi:hypothetical protein